MRGGGFRLTGVVSLNILEAARESLGYDVGILQQPIYFSFYADRLKYKLYA